MLDDLKTQFGSSLKMVHRLLLRPAPGKRGGARPARSHPQDEQRQRTRRMRHDLYALLEQHSGSRKLMRHLDLVEQTLRQQGWPAVEALPLRVLAMGLQQLERLVWDWSAPGLAELRSRLAIRVKQRQAEELQDRSPSADRDFARLAAQATDVSEVDHAVFEEMERSWVGQVPAGMGAGR